ncbi:MAG: hypothetical protein MOGMAGMI_01927 [Candidatus Omnitrophica bacterium]|nr:hypothetical protein [Candidatus Omnitrophota bacterium]
MKVRDSFAVINGDTAIIEMPSGGLEIVADDGHALFALRLTKDGTLEVSGGNTCKHGGELLEERLQIEPRACNLVYVRKSKYEA